MVYPFEDLTDALRNFLLARQNKGEATIDFIKRRKQIGSTVLQFLGKDFLDNFIRTTEWYHDADENEKSNLLKNSSQLWQSYLMIRNGEKDQFGDLMEHLQKQYALGTDQFPKTLTNVADVMAAHEAKTSQEKAKREKNDKNEKNDKRPRNNQNTQNHTPRGGNETSYG